MFSGYGLESSDTTDTKCLGQNVNSGLNREQHGQNDQLMFQLSQTQSNYVEMLIFGIIASASFRTPGLSGFID